MSFARKTQFCLVVIVSIILSMSFSAQAAQDVYTGAEITEDSFNKSRFTLANDQWMQIHGFLQTGYRGCVNKDYNSYDFYVKRARLIVNGEAASKVDFLFATNDAHVNDNTATAKNPNIQASKYSQYTQDAFIHLNVVDYCQIYTGLMAVPYNRMNLQSNATTLATEKINRMVPLGGITNNGRDVGLLFRGFLFKRYLEYRIGGFKGLGRKEITDDTGKVVKTRNKNDYPRLTARLQLSVLDREDSYYYSENYLGKKDVVTLGFGFDFQPDVCESGKKSYKNYYSWTADLSVDKGLGGGFSFPVQVGFIYSWNNPAEYTDTRFNYTGDKFGTIYGFYGQVGLLMMDKYQPYIEFYRRGNSGEKKYSSFIGGFTFFFNGHNANMKVEGTLPVSSNEHMDNEKKLDVQFQIYL